MKVISLLQPWASLVVMGHKKIETRSWNTKYRGELLIHASLGKDKDGYKLWHSKYCWDHVTDNKHFVELPFGAIIGKVDLITTMLMVDVVQQKQRGNFDGIFFNEHGAKLTEQEIAYGNYKGVRYGWLLANHVEFKTPIPTKGSLGFWDYPSGIPGNV